MPLVQSASDKARSKNIATLRREGVPQKQATAIAYNVQRRASGSRHASKPKRKRSPAQLAAFERMRAGLAKKNAGKKPRKRAQKRRVTNNVTPAIVTGMRTSARRRRRRSSTKLARVGGHARKLSRVRHVGRVVGGIASAEKHRTGAFIVAAGLGIAKKQGIEIPHLETVGEAGSLALGAFAARKFAGISSPWLDHLITAAGVIAIYDVASTGNIPFLGTGGGGKKKGAKTEGDDDDVDGYNVR
jgi:hypothetical protein